MSKLNRLVAALAAAMVTVFPAAPSVAAPAAAGAAVAAVVADPTNRATDEEKVKAAAALGISPGMDLLVLDDQQFVLAIWRAANEDTYVKAEALRAYDDSDPNSAYTYITVGIFDAADRDAQVEIAAEQAKARRRSVAVTVGLDPKDTALIEKGDRDFIFAVWQRVASGSKVSAAARDALRDGSGEADWTAFLTTGAQAAAAQDMADAIAAADAEKAARLRAEQLSTAKRALLQLLLLPVSDELANAPDRQYVLAVHAQAKGVEVRLASQAALNAPDPDLAKALSDFIFTGGAAANARDEQAAAAKELADYRAKATAIRDGARRDGQQPNLLAAADKALAANTLLALQTFLLKGQDEARALDKGLSQRTVNLVISQSSKQCLAIGGAAKESGAHAIQWPCTGGTEQDWQIYARSGGRYELRNDHSDMCLALAAPSKEKGVHVVQQPCRTASEDQYWQLSKDANGYTELRNTFSNQCLAIGGGSKEEGAHAIQWTCNASTVDQNWQIKSRVIGQQIRNVNSGMCLSNGGSKDTGAHIIQTACSDSNDAEWHLTSRPDGNVEIRSDHSNLCVSIAAGSKENGAHAIQWTCDATKKDRQWQIMGDGAAVQLRNVNSNQCLSIGSGSKEEDAHAIQWTCDATKKDRQWNIPGK
ncbi:RICIN domain-containing protein [Actinoplanes sp. NPDC049681]|uniref:RICIN domain-containing protein n=1 Tax=Actinoplanes sp. NPDC049681 TaxID=3363905 RepID=UPI0037927C45